MKIYIDCDEMYPCYGISKFSGEKIDVPHKKIEEWEDIQARYDKMQDELEKYYEEVKK
jgi:hypothetical protein